MIGPENTQAHLENAVNFMGEWWHDLQVVELPDDLKYEPMQVDEESKDDS